LIHESLRLKKDESEPEDDSDFDNLEDNQDFRRDEIRGKDVKNKGMIKAQAICNDNEPATETSGEMDVPSELETDG